MSACKLLIERLKGGQTERIKEELIPEFLGPDEDELKFKKSVFVIGKAYLVDDHLMIQLEASTKIAMPCSICNEMTETELKADRFYHAEPIEKIPSKVFDYEKLLREALLLELPRTVECNRGKCPQKASLKRYMRFKEPSNFPFADIDKM